MSGGETLTAQQAEGLLAAIDREPASSISAWAEAVEAMRMAALAALRTVIADSARVAALEAELDRERAMSVLLRSDLEKLSDGDLNRCEGCGAPLGDDDEASTVDDVRGCWGFVADVKGSPCYRYRTAAGLDRAWPECAALASRSPREAQK